MENINTISVPEGIRYMSQWIDFELPSYPHIMNKQLTGCGFTEYFLRPNSKYPRVILISPRRILLENKEDQHNNPKDGIDIGRIYYARNDLETDKGYDIDMTKDNTKDAEEKKLTEEEKKKEETKRRIEAFKNNVRSYVMECEYNQKDIRIIVTYDSFRLVREALGNDIYNYQIVVDEFQSLLPDSVFKSDTELSLLHHLKDLQHLCFLSATPMLFKYTQMLSDFKDLPYFELDWETEQPERVLRLNIDRKQCTSVITEAKKEIDRYLQGDFERYSWRDECGSIQEKFSTELVVYVNSVKNICDIIKKCGLIPDQCNILCADTSENKKKLREAFSKVGVKGTRGQNYIGTVPQKGEIHKMFTFCTRTVFLGADFYSTCARSLVLSDANVKCMVIDISTDFIQIGGRQRLVKENPWAYSIIFRFKTNFEDISEEKFEADLQEKTRKTNSLIQTWNEVSDTSRKHDLADGWERMAKSEKYKYNFLSVNHHMGSDLKPVFNELVMVAERRAFDLQSKDYASRISVMSELEQRCGVNNQNDEVHRFHTFFESLSTGQEKMKYLCEFLNYRKDLEEEVLISVPLAYKNYYTVLGSERCRQIGYQMSKLEKEYQKQLNNQKIPEEDLLQLIYSSFQEGERYLGSDLKKTVQGIYNSLGLKKTGKAKDFEEWFELKECLVSDPLSKKRGRGYELIKRKF